MARATMARAYLIMLAVMGALVKRALSQSANQGWMYGVKNNDPKVQGVSCSLPPNQNPSDSNSSSQHPPAQQFYLYNPTIDPPIGPIEFDPWPTGAPAGSWNANDLMDGIAMDSTNNQLIFPKCRVRACPCMLSLMRTERHVHRSFPSFLSHGADAVQRPKQLLL